MPKTVEAIWGVIASVGMIGAVISLHIEDKRKEPQRCHACGAELYRNKPEHDPDETLERICIECGAVNEEDD